MTSGITKIIQPQSPLTDGDVWKLRDYIRSGNIHAAKEFIESKGMKWLSNEEDAALVQKLRNE